MSETIIRQLSMNHVTLGQSKKAIVKRIGYFPAFLIPAVDSSSIYSSLVKQTLFSYINNPLPFQFKEKLAIALSSHLDIPYFTICHSCTLYSLGVSPQEILGLVKIEFPQTEKLAIAELQSLDDSLWQDWQNNSQIEAILLRCSGFIFLNSKASSDLCNQLKSLLGKVSYHYLLVLLGFIKLCHKWVIANPIISHQKDRRSQMYLGSLLLEEIELAKFFQTKISATSSFVGQSCHLPHSVAKRQNLSSVDLEKKYSSSSIINRLGRKCATYLENAPFPVMIHDRAERILYLNQNWSEITGYTQAQISTIDEWKQKISLGQEKIVKLPLKSLSKDLQYSVPTIKIAEEIINRLQQIFNYLSVSDSTVEIQEAKNQIIKAVRNEITIITSSGEQRRWQLYSTPLNYDNGDRWTISIAKDLTNLIRYQTKLTEVKSKLESVLEVTKTGYWTWDIIANQVYICHRGRTILGLENFDGTYISLLQSIHFSEREFVDLEIARAIQTRQDFNLKYHLNKLDRQTTLIRNFGKLQYNAKGQPVSVLGIVTDVTSNQTNRVKNLDLDRHGLKKQLPNKDRLLKSDTLGSIEFQAIFNLLPYYMFVVDLETQTVLSMNLNMAQSLCLENPEAARGKAIAECFAPEYVDLIAQQHQQITINREMVRFRQKMTLPDRIHYFDTALVPLLDRNESVYAVLHTYSDLADLADTEEALSQRTIQLEAANRELESFSSSVSHDLQAPLRIINGFSQVLWEQYRSDLDDRGKHYLERIQANSQRMSSLIDALLQLSRVTRSQMKSVNVNLSAMASDIVEELRLENPQRQVEVNIAPNLKVKGDPQLLKIVLSNLFNNAWKYTSKRAYGKIEFGSISNPQQPSTYYLRDNGAGFDSNYADKLFTAFQRLHSAEEFPGTGIGLATVQRIIYRHGGRVWAQGECDRGATIYFSL